ncbi:hypothetical protein [Archangium sp.]|uniref:hypothetical protein n=1 Tax=Archangium sp. TaxID=1872627 RepID=UPI00286CC6A8|nr:hypothetical protein [Archangium sp.]
MRSHRPDLLLLLVACVLACGGPRQDRLHVAEVSPSQAPFGASTSLLLRGLFAPDLVVDLDSDAPPTLENRFEVYIGPERAYAVRFRSRETLEATVPATLPPGVYDVLVKDAEGHGATLSGAFRVIDRDVHRLTFVTSMRSAHPDTWTEPLRIELRDAQGLPAPTSSPRRVVVTSNSPTGRFALLGKQEVVHATPLEVMLAPGESGLDILYQDTASGYHTLESSTLGLPSIFQTVAVGRLGPPTAVRFTGLPDLPLVAGTPVALAVEVVDASGGPASFPAAGLQLELSTSSPSGAVYPQQGDPAGSTLSRHLVDASQGRFSFFYRVTRSSAEVWLSASALNLETRAPLEPHTVSLPVVPGPAFRFEVSRADTGLVQVGVPERFTLRALDAWGNLTPSAGPVHLRAVPEDPGFSPPQVRLEAGGASFDAQFTRVQPVAVVATDPSTPTVRGASAELSIRPGPPVRLEVSGVEGPQRVGVPFPLTLAALDRYGNRAETLLSVTLAAPGVPSGALSPTTSGTFTGATTLSVTLTSTVEETHLALTGETLATRTRGFAVLPGPTQRFEVTDTPGPKTAGVPFRVSLRAVDAFGNTSQDLHELELGAQGVAGHLVSPSRWPGFRGQAEVEVSVNQATSSTRVGVTAGTARGQQAGTFSVNPGSHVGFRLDAPTCVTARDKWKLTLHAVDSWGNTVPSFEGYAKLFVSPFGDISPSSTPAFSKGTSTITNVSLELVNGGEPTSCLVLTATDNDDPGNTGTTCLNLQTTCPK